jgi:hypothetical protein
VTIGKLPDDVLLKIFRYYLDASPRFWLRLVHICRKWRRITFASESQRVLHVRLFCTHGTPVLKTLDFWPNLPIVVQYREFPSLDRPAPEDEDNIVAALQKSERVSSIDLTVTSSLLEKISAIEGQFSELEDLFLLSRDSPQPTLRLGTAFGWGTQLRSLRLTRIALFSLPQLLYSSRKLVDLQLHEVFDPWLFSPEALIDALSGMTQLRSLLLHLPLTAHCLSPSPSSKERVVLPVLLRFNFRGIAEYLERLIAGIDAPRLGDIEVAFHSGLFVGLPALRVFINRVEMHKAHRRADILSSKRAISISLTQPGVPTRLQIRIFCKPLSAQLSSMARICIHFSAFLFNVEDLRIGSTRAPGRQASRDWQQWLRLIYPFRGTKRLDIAGVFSENIVRALKPQVRRRKAVLPALHKLYISQPMPRPMPLSNPIVSYMTSRRFSGHPIAVEYERPCGISEFCRTGALFSKCHHQCLLTRLLQDLLRRL